MSALSLRLNYNTHVSESNKLLRVELDPCGHVFCCHCLAEMEAARGLKQLKCCMCKSSFYKHTCWKFPPKQRARSKPKPPEPPNKRPCLRSDKKRTRDAIDGDNNDNDEEEEEERAFRDSHSIDIFVTSQ